MQVSGNKISAAKTSDLVTVVSSNAATLPVQVKNVAAGIVAVYVFLLHCFNANV